MSGRATWTWPSRWPRPRASLCCVGQALTWANTAFAREARQMQQAVRLALPDFDAFANAARSVG
eukprot:15025797-Alexandrium_andersonii.AAC.1